MARGQLGGVSGKISRLWELFPETCSILKHFRCIVVAEGLRLKPATPKAAITAARRSEDGRVWFGVVNRLRGELSVQWCYAKDILAHNVKGRRNLFIDMLQKAFGGNLYVLTPHDAMTLRSELRALRDARIADGDNTTTP